MDERAVLLTGANGFLGRSILTRLHFEGATVHASGRGRAAFSKETGYTTADITREDDLTDLFDKEAVVIHAAGLAHVRGSAAGAGDAFRRINEIGTENVAKAAAKAGAGHLVLMSSVSVYGPSGDGIIDERSPCRPVGPYALSKRGAEKRAISVAANTGMALTILRLATLYGEGDPGNVGRLIRSLDRRRFVWVGDGRNRKSLLHKRDAARACAAVALRPATGIRIYNVAAPPCTMREIVTAISDALGKRPFPLRMPAKATLSLSRHLSRFPAKRLAGIHHTVCKWLSEDVFDTTRFEHDFRFSPEVSTYEGLCREVEWYRKRV